MSADFQPILIHDFLDSQTLDDLNSKINQVKIKNPGFFDFDPGFQRYYVNSASFFLSMHKNLNSWLETTLNRNTKPSYSFFIEYVEGGNCPKHTDRPPCKYTIAICLEQVGDQPFIIENQTYSLTTNSLLLYSGTDHVHERVVVKKGTARLILFHYVDHDYDGELI
jgi:hypothetical protein